MNTDFTPYALVFGDILRARWLQALPRFKIAGRQIA
jgi:hypothetical protein